VKSFHSQIRQQQRGISDEIVELVRLFGDAAPARGDALALELPRGFLQLAERAMNCRVIMGERGIITVEHLLKGAKRRRKDTNRSCPVKQTQG